MKEIQALRELLSRIDPVTKSHGSLPAGEVSFAGLARTLSNEPDLFLADETTGSLDGRSVGRILDLFARLMSERPAVTMIIVTHDPRVATTADRMIHPRDGRVDRDPRR